MRTFLFEFYILTQFQSYDINKAYSVKVIPFPPLCQNNVCLSVGTFSRSIVIIKSASLINVTYFFVGGTNGQLPPPPKKKLPKCNICLVFLDNSEKFSLIISLTPVIHCSL